MKYEYKFRNETITIEVNDSDYNVLISLDREEYNLNHKHERRYPLSLEVALGSAGEERDNGRLRRKHPKTINGAICDNPIAADDSDTLGELISSQNHQAIRKAIQELLPQQQDLVFKVFYQDRSIISIADEEGVSEAAVRNRLKKIYAKLKKLLE